MLGDHPEAAAEARYDLGCAWYSDHGPFYSGLQPAWFLIGLPCIAATALALASTCGLACGPRGAQQSVREIGAPTAYSAHYGLLIEVSGVPVDTDVDGRVHRWVGLGSCGAMCHGVLLAALALFIALHANNEAEFTFFVDAVVALAMAACKLAVALCAREVHVRLSRRSREVAKHWTLVLAFSKVLAAVCALALALVYLVLGSQGVDSNMGDGSRRRPTPREQAQLCKAGFLMVWSFMASLVSQALAGFALSRIYANAVLCFGDPQVFRRVVDCWWGVLVVCTCGVGIALWLGCAVCVFPALDISPLRMMGFFYAGAAVCQVLAGVAMRRCNESIRRYWETWSAAAGNEGTQHGLPVAVGAAVPATVGVPVGQPVGQARARPAKL